MTSEFEEEAMKKVLLIAAVSTLALSAPAFAEDVGVGVGPVGAGVTVGSSHDRYIDRDHDRTTVIHEHEPRDKTVVIKKDRPEVEKKTIIHEHD
jgi:hypothetical protein